MLAADLFRIFFCNCKVRIARAMEFRIDFFTGILTDFIFSCAAPLFQLLIYRNTSGYPGWNIDQILLFQALLLFWTGLITTLFGNTRPLMEICAKYGLFDRYRVFPHSSIGLILTAGFDYRSSGTLLAGIIGFIYCMVKLKLKLNWGQIVLFLFFQVDGIFLYLAFMICYCTLTLKFINVIRINEILNNIIFFGNFPAEVFSGMLKFLYLSVLPLAIWIYYPAQVLLGRIKLFPFIAAIMSLILFAGALLFWSIQLKKYTSAGG